jgi:hypothetical protein
LTTDGDEGWIVPEFTWNPGNDELWFTENRIPRGLAVPLPLDVANQARDSVEYLLHPSLSPQQIADGHPGDTLIPVQQRTRIIRFPGACAPPAELTFRLHHSRGARVVRASATVVGSPGVVRRGRALKHIAIRRPEPAEFSVRVASVDSSGARSTRTYDYTGLGCYRH